MRIPMRIRPWKGLLVVAGCAFLAALLVSGKSQIAQPLDFRAASPGIVAKAPTEASLTVTYPDGRVRTFAGEIVNGMTVYDVLNAAQIGSADTFAITFDGKEEERAVVSVDGIQNGEQGKFWRIVLNNETRFASPESIPVAVGDDVELRYE
ncbi:MAG: hypothetical protein HY460_02985 [Parcubacteria group bacterium]|nr:hypothetical protein [Parcubacteria group bacterium]